MLLVRPQDVFSQHQIVNVQLILGERLQNIFDCVQLRGEGAMNLSR